MEPLGLQQSVWGNTLQYRVQPDQEDRPSSSNENLEDRFCFKSPKTKTFSSQAKRKKTTVTTYITYIIGCI